MTNKQPIWLVWVDGLPKDQAQPQLEYLEKRHGPQYEFRIIKSPFHGGKAIEGRKLTELNMQEDGPVLRSELPMSFRRLIKNKEQYLDRRCGKIWIATNPLNERFVYGRFNKGRKDCVIVTIGSRIPHVGWIPAN